MLTVRLPRDGGLEILEQRVDIGHLPVGWVARMRELGHITLENPRPVTRPGGPPHDPWLGAIVGVEADGSPIRRNHEFIHADALVFHTVEGDIRFRVLRQPDKYVSGDAGGDEKVTPDVYATPSGTDVEGYYTCKRED